MHTPDLAFLFPGPLRCDEQTRGSFSGFWLFYYQSFFFQPHFCDVYSDMKVVLLAVYSIFFFYEH
jgi:hypothetical protein